ncbi:DNA polymerase III subunit alpha [Elstera cyanobacteriorum]|uniref:DNA polymerase III subunit alpha n=1 Tax=Elstera cyanobacteriorum TaxID=2022747 RepID=A0A255XNY5_9PROT|nr:DNA polymerase III subunit alpha [Elstera cyanobacteriorum]OYQ18693.1 DNA polymerase III subunit alpha [Elstera cyanobacteriorum]
MSHSPFVHLRTHSAYSLSEGAIKMKELVKLAAGAKMPAVAVTDTGNLFGAIEFSQAAADVGVQPILGAILHVRRTDGVTRPGLPLPPDPLLLLCQDMGGYENLLKLVSHAFLETESHETPQVSLALVAQHAEGLIALTGGVGGWIGRLLHDGQRDAAEAAVLRLKEIFGDRLYLELQRHGDPREALVEPGVVDFAYAHDIPLVATNDVYFATPGMYEAHDVLLCIADGVTLEHSDRRRLTPEHYFKTGEQMGALFADLPEAILNTAVIAQRCAVSAPLRKPILPAFDSGQGRDEPSELRVMAEEGLRKRLESGVFTPEMDAAAREAAAKPYWDRLAFELDVIIKMGFPGYFLIVADFIQWAKDQGIPVGPGRGSGAGSAVAWALTITDLDPLRFGLLFERFLNPERVSMPDFDIDFCQDRRDQVIRYVQEKYGHDRVAQIITFGKLQARAVLRDVGRVLGMPYGQVDRICKMVPNNPANPVTLEEAIKGEAQLQQMRDSDEQVARLLAIGQKLEGLYRHASTHAAGVVIGDRPLDQLVPLYRDPRSTMPVTQFNMKFVEQAGLVKFDFLGLKTLTVLVRAVELIAQRGITIDLAQIPLDDAATYKMLSRGDATGVFQLESSGMRDVLRNLRPDRVEDLIAVVALYRPGPMDNIPSYINRKHGRETPDYLHPLLEGILKETFGIAIYQEQVMQIAQALSGYTLGGADLLRRAMGKKIKAEMDAQRETFCAGAKANGVDPKQASMIFDQVEKFAGYGFNKSHAAAYALVSYQTAYLKANYPVEFFAASMTYDMSNTDKLNVFRQELSRLGIPLLGPDVNASAPDFSVETLADGKLAVRYALAAVKNVGDQAMKALVAERAKGGPFKSLQDFAARLDPKTLNKRQIENLSLAGAFDSLDKNRARVFGAAEAVMRHAQLLTEEKASNQVSLFGGGAGAVEAPPLPLPNVLDFPPHERLQKEFDAVGFYLSAHPLDVYERALKRLGITRAADFTHKIRPGEPQRVKVAGIVLGRREITTARGSRVAFVQLSDASGSYEVTLFSEVLAVSREMLDANKPLLLHVEARLEGEGVKLLAQQVGLLDAATENTVSGMRIYLADESPVADLKKILRDSGDQFRGRGRISLLLDLEECDVEIPLTGGFAVTPALRAMVKSLPGVVDVEEL